MFDPYRALRCRPGDLAVIVQDEPECRANIGQIVRVIGEYTPFRGEPVFYWLVEPQSSGPSPVLVGTPSSGERELVHVVGPRAHEDNWLHALSVASDNRSHGPAPLVFEVPAESEWRDPVRLRVT
jgi:hypothetical protein